MLTQTVFHCAHCFTQLMLLLLSYMFTTVNVYFTDTFFEMFIVILTMNIASILVLYIVIATNNF